MHLPCGLRSELAPAARFPGVATPGLLLWAVVCQVVAAVVDVAVPDVITCRRRRHRGRRVFKVLGRGLFSSVVGVERRFVDAVEIKVLVLVHRKNRGLREWGVKSAWVVGHVAFERCEQHLWVSNI